MSDFAKKLIELAKKTNLSSGGTVISALKKDETLAERLLALIKSIYPDFDFEHDLSYLGSGSNAICLEIRDSSQHSVVMKLGEQKLRKGEPVKHKHLLSSKLEREITDAEGNCVLTIVIQDKVKTYSEYVYSEDVITTEEVYQMMKSLISDGIIVCDIENPLANIGRAEDGSLIVFDTESVRTKEELGDEWDNTCHQAIYGEGVKCPSYLHYLTKEEKEKGISMQH